MSNDNYNRNKDDKSSSYDLSKRRFPKPSQKANTIALTAITCLFLGVLGYEIIRENNNESLQISTKPAEKVLIVNNVYTSQSFDEELEDEQLLALKEKNKLQRQKIKVLKNTLVESQKQSHEIKASLFCQQGTPLDKEKIRKLENDIKSQKFAHNELKEQSLFLQQKLSDALQAGASAEDIQRTLIAAIEQEKASHEQNLLATKQEIERIKLEAKAENDEIEKQVRLLEITQKCLSEGIDNKNSTLRDLERQIEEGDNNLLVKSQEIEKLQEMLCEFEEAIETGIVMNHSAQKEHSKEMLQLQSLFGDFMTQLELEQTKNVILAKEKFLLEERDLKQAASIISTLQSALESYDIAYSLKPTNRQPENRNEESMQTFVFSEDLYKKQANEYEQKNLQLQEDLMQALQLLEDRQKIIDSLSDSHLLEQENFKHKIEELKSEISKGEQKANEEQEKIASLYYSYEQEQYKSNLLEKELQDIAIEAIVLEEKLKQQLEIFSEKG